MDQLVELDISDDVNFTMNGRCLDIEAYHPESHNGMYVCYASNALGSKEYSDRGLLYLYAECESLANTIYSQQCLANTMDRCLAHSKHSQESLVYLHDIIVIAHNQPLYPPLTVFRL